MTGSRYGGAGAGLQTEPVGTRIPGELAVIGFQGRENVRHSKNGKSQPASIVAIRHNVRFEAQKRTPSQKKEIF